MINPDQEKLEMMIAHQDKQIQDLNDIVTKQWEEIDSLKRYMQLTKAKIQELEQNIGPKEDMTPTEEAAANKPPHY